MISAAVVSIHTLPGRGDAQGSARGSGVLAWRRLALVVFPHNLVRQLFPVRLLEDKSINAWESVDVNGPNPAVGPVRGAYPLAMSAAFP